uniref:Type IV secretory system conjugative DNA transfer family protein n=1 Tax=Roseihalotalea indica TaxID=2867963 RepID=A0AA49GRK6_9BACT|nr:type IV secretory system conjugative DNA transfer family protein [Tunicatimonas sp. TK19036]
MRAYDTTSLEALLFFWVGLLVLLTLEYLVLIQVDLLSWLSTYEIAAGGIAGIRKIGFFLRGFTALTYAGLSGVLLKSTQSPTEHQGSLRRWRLITTFLLLLMGLYVLITVHDYALPIIVWLYPVSFTGVLILIPMLIHQVQRVMGRSREQVEKRKLESDYSIHIRCKRGWINVVNPFRGTLVIGSSGSGKSESIGNAFLHQFVQKGYSGIVYDFKFPTLSEVVHTTLYQKVMTNLTYYIVNFQDLTRSHRCNPLSPENIPTLAHAEEYARTIVNNLDTGTIKHQEFFSSSATAWLAALIWFYRCEHPEHCTLPHVINTALYEDYTHVISMLEANPGSADLIRSIATAIINKADKQIAGVIASLQIMVTRINSPEIVWVLTGDDFTMNINDPDDPKLLCLGSNPALVDTFRPVISLIIAVALKQMNQPAKCKSFVLLDEAPTLYIPKFELIPATARSNQVASVYMAQDIAQMVDMFGKEKAEVIIANLSNQFYGKASSLPTAKMVSEMIGKEEQRITNHSRGNSRDSKGRYNLSYNASISQQERYLIKSQEVMQLRPGEFIGQTVESSIPYFRAQTRPAIIKPSDPLQAFATGERADLTQLVDANFRQVRKEVAAVVGRYPNVYTAQ